MMMSSMTKTWYSSSTRCSQKCLLKNAVRSCTSFATWITDMSSAETNTGNLKRHWSARETKTRLLLNVTLSTLCDS